jgi:hypothetical protein
MLHSNVSMSSSLILKLALILAAGAISACHYEQGYVEQSYAVEGRLMDGFHSQFPGFKMSTAYPAWRPVSIWDRLAVQYYCGIAFVRDEKDTTDIVITKCISQVHFKSDQDTLAKTLYVLVHDYPSEHLSRPKAIDSSTYVALKRNETYSSSFMSPHFRKFADMPDSVRTLTQQTPRLSVLFYYYDIPDGIQQIQYYLSFEANRLNQVYSIDTTLNLVFRKSHYIRWNELLGANEVGNSKSLANSSRSTDTLFNAIHPSRPWRPPNQSLKLTAHTWLRTRNAQEMSHYWHTRRDMSSEFRIVRGERYQRRSLAPIR